MHTLKGETITTRIYQIAHAAGADAATRNMRAHGRIRWNDDDWDLAIAEMDRILGNTVDPPQLMERSA